MAQMGSGTNELASVLVDEFGEWYRNLATRGAVPCAFTGVAANGNQAVVILTGLSLNRVQRREFLIWLCLRRALLVTRIRLKVSIRQRPRNRRARVTENGYDNWIRRLPWRRWVLRPAASIPKARAHADGSKDDLRYANRSASHALGSMSLRRAVMIRVFMTAARSAPRSNPANNYALRPRAKPTQASFCNVVGQTNPAIFDETREAV
jgi:hypothetical protein